MLALSTALLSSGCASHGERLGAAKSEIARADLVDQALSAHQLPDLPADCRVKEVSGVKEGDRLDVALLKSERALGRANARVERCAEFYDSIQDRPNEMPRVE